MRLWVTLYSTTDSSHSNAFTLECRTVQQAVNALPRLLERHLQRPHADCPLDAWTVHTVHAVTNLPRIQRRGVIRDGTAVPNDTDQDRMAD